MPKITRKRSKSKASKSKTCCICIETINPSDEARITGCRHRYCKGCIREWSKYENSCPQCKRRFNWIVDVKTKKKESVHVRNQKDTNFLMFVKSLLRNFLYNTDFRRFMTIGIIQANRSVLSLFRFLYSIIHDFNLRTVIERQTEPIEKAFEWLDNMNEISGVDI